MIALAILGCSDPLQAELPSLESWDDLQATASRLSPEDQDLLERYHQRYSPGGAMADHGWTPGTRIEHALAEQARWDEQTAIAEAETKRIAAEKAAASKALQGTTSVVLVGVEYDNADWRTGKTEATLFAEFEIHNLTPKQVTGVHGDIVLSKAEGHPLVEIPVHLGEPIGGKGKRRWRYDFLVDPNSSSQRQLISTEPDALLVEWQPKTIGYADGSVISAE